jgi:hypothetical protein
MSNLHATIFLKKILSFRKMGNQLNKFILLMWKNWTLLKRRPIHTAFEIIYPVLICFILVAIRNIITAEQRDQQDYVPFDVTDSWYYWYSEACHENDSYVKVLYFLNKNSASSQIFLVTSSTPS